MPTRQIMWNVGGEFLIYLFLVPTLAIFAYGVYLRWQLWRLGQPEQYDRRLGYRLRSVLVYALLQRRLPAYPAAGMMHILVFAGFLVLFIGTVLVFLQKDFGLPILYGQFYLLFKLALNVFGLLLIAGLLVAIWLRYVKPTPRLERPGRRGRYDNGIVLALLLANALAGFGLQGLRIAVTREPWAAWEFAGAWLAAAIDASQLPQSTLLTAHAVLWWAHLALAFALIAYIPYSKLFHLFTAPANIFLRPIKPTGALPPVKDIEQAEFLGVSQIGQYNARELFQLDACMECGRCQDQCPAFQAGLPLSPKALILDLRHHLEQKGDARFPWRSPRANGSKPLIGGSILETTLWACTTCRACSAICPALIEHVPKIVALRRHLAMEQGRLPGRTTAAIRSLEARGHPLGGTPYKRTDWAKDLAVPLLSQRPETPLLYWVGCMGAMDDRAMQASRAFARLLQAARVDFAILGNEERCTGDLARRLGHEYLFQTLAQENIGVLNGYGVRRIVTTCAHCFNTLKNEYPQFGGHYEVLHHSTLLAGLLREGRLRPTRVLDAAITYHDSCYLGRYNGVYGEPREVVQAADGRLVEMPAKRERGLCCGAGGGRFWSEDQTDPRINRLRVAQVLGTASATVATACPYCLVMIEDGLRAHGRQDEVRALDLAEVLERAL